MPATMTVIVHYRDGRHVSYEDVRSLEASIDQRLGPHLTAPAVAGGGFDLGGAIGEVLIRFGAGAEARPPADLIPRALALLRHYQERTAGPQLVEAQCGDCTRSFYVSASAPSHMDGLEDDGHLSCPWCDGNAAVESGQDG